MYYKQTMNQTNQCQLDLGPSFDDNHKLPKPNSQIYISQSQNSKNSHHTKQRTVASPSSASFSSCSSSLPQLTVAMMTATMIAMKTAALTFSQSHWYWWRYGAWFSYLWALLLVVFHLLKMEWGVFVFGDPVCWGCGFGYVYDALFEWCKWNFWGLDTTKRYTSAFMLACVGYLLTMVADCVVSSVFRSDEKAGDLELLLFFFSFFFLFFFLIWDLSKISINVDEWDVNP